MAARRRRNAEPATHAQLAAGRPGIERLVAWMHARGWTPRPFQEDVWRHQSRGESGLINVPTGAGKTYAAYFGALASAMDAPASGLRVLWITPLRAVSRDTKAALELPIRALGVDITVASRTGDTSAGERARQRDVLPGVLVTTPESLSLLIGLADAQDRFKNLACVIVDEWHELISTKRGTQVELALSRLRRWRPTLMTWALSATLQNLDEAARAAAGVGCTPVIVRAPMDRPVQIDGLIPADIRRFPWAGHLGLAMLSPLLEWLDPAVSTLVFTNTRSQAEKWYQALRLAPGGAAERGWENRLALHHGSIDRTQRERIEAGLKSGEITVCVCTSSLDLGVDFAPVERVVQIGSPKGVARLVQRAGRSGHRPGAACRVLCVPTHALELVEIAAVREAVVHGLVEPRTPVDRPLDVLVQHLVTCALGGGFRADALFDEVRTTAAFEKLTREEFDWALSIVVHGGTTLRAYPDYHRVCEDDGVYRVTNRRIAQLHRLNVGTIVSDATMDIRYARGKRLGSIEESFIARLKPGERFFFAGKTVRFVGVREMAAIVAPARGRAALTPIWGGTRLPISESLGDAVRRALDRAAHDAADSPELASIKPVLDVQARLSRVPLAHQTLVERCTTREGHHLFMYPFEGRLVHGGLAALLAWRLAARAGQAGATFTTAATDYGLELLSPTPIDFDAASAVDLFRTERLIDDALHSINLALLAKREFAEIARVSGLVWQTHPGARKSGRQVRTSTSLIYDVFREFDPGNPLLAQAERAVLDRQFEQSRLARTLRRLSAPGALLIVDVVRPTPLGLPLVIERVGAHLSTESITQRVERMKDLWEKDAAKT